jgi:putative membrane protein
MFPFYLVFILGMIYFLIDKKGKSEILLAFFFLYLALFVGLGDMIGGYDRYIYGEMFDTIADETRSSHNYGRLLYLVNGKEFGYFAWQILVSYVTANRYIYILITTLFIYLLYFISFRRYLERYPFAVIIFLGLLYYFTMTYLRQVIAAGIVWIAIPYIWKRKPIKFFLLVLLAYSFHNSAIIFSIMYFIPIRRYTPSTIIIFIVICFLLGLTPIPQMLMASSSTRANEYENETQGFRIEYVLEAAFFLFIILKNYNKTGNSKKEIVFTNMSFVFCALLLLFMRFGQGGRITWFFFMGIIYTIQYLCYAKNIPLWLKPFVLVVLFFLFNRITIAWAPMHAPYKTFLTNGKPNGYIYYSHEYDERYTENKFYR